jgi:3-deoxy-D-manno-octulosonic acid kinase
MQMPAPAGYVWLGGPRGARVLALREHADAILKLLDSSTLYDAAAARRDGLVFQGRAPAYELALPAERVVVRHNWHGGAFARLTRDRFLRGGRTDIELNASERLRDAGIATPRIVAVVTYPAGPGFSRADVATRLVPDARDLSGCLCDTDPATRKRAVAAAGALLDQLAAVGARHRDLNVKNVLLRHRPDAGFQPYVLDVDRVTFHEPHDPDVIRGNAERLLRSARKWRRLHGARVTDAELTAWQARDTTASTRRPPLPT